MEYNKKTTACKNLIMNKSTPLTEAEEKVLMIIRDIKYGEVKVVIQDGVPVRVDEIKKSIKI